MFGSITGDVIGSFYEWHNIKDTGFMLFRPESKFTDDTTMSIAVADALLHGKAYTESMREWGRRYPGAGYGGIFRQWLKLDDGQPYNSWGNGSAMRVGPVGWVFDTLEETLAEAKRSAEVTHNHPEGIKGAQAVAAAVFMARQNAGKDQIKDYIQTQFGYDLERRIDDIRPIYKFDVSCQGSVPESIIAFLESSDFENSLRLAISIGGDSDTIACMTGSIAQAFYKHIPDNILSQVRERLTPEILALADAFEARFVIPHLS